MDILKINPYIRTALQSEFPAFYEMKKRIIFDYELVYIESGILILVYNDIEFVCHPGDILLIHPGITHSFKSLESGFSQPHIHFDLFYNQNSEVTPISFKNIGEMSAFEKTLIQDDPLKNHENSPRVTVNNKKRFLHLFYKVIKLQKSADMLKSKAALLEIIEMLIANNFTDSFSSIQNSCKITEQIKNFFDAGQGHKTTLLDIEKQFNYDRFYLSKLFKNEYNISIIAYRNKIRMEYAYKLLEVHSVTTVSNEIGFKTPFSFSRAFKSEFGISPIELKKKYISNKKPR